VAGEATVRTDCLVEPEGSGTRLTVGAEGHFNTRLLRLLSPLAIAVMKRQARSDMVRLKTALEAARPPSA
jgi:hypothetical protein